jgi:CheY-like chemotaxis protein
MAPLRVLLVEDNADIAYVMQALVKRVGHEVRWAANGSAALDQAQQWSPQIGLIDIGLPDMNGNQLAIALRQLNFSQPLLLVALTGFGEQDDRSRAKDAGFDRFFVKPITMDGLRDIFSSYESIEPTLNSSA